MVWLVQLQLWYSIFSMIGINMSITLFLILVYSLIGKIIYWYYLKKCYGRYAYPQDVVDYIIGILCGPIIIFGLIKYYLNKD